MSKDSSAISLKRDRVHIRIWWANICYATAARHCIRCQQCYYISSPFIPLTLNLINYTTVLYKESNMDVSLFWGYIITSNNKTTLKQKQIVSETYSPDRRKLPIMVPQSYPASLNVPVKCVCTNRNWKLILERMYARFVWSTNSCARSIMDWWLDGSRKYSSSLPEHDEPWPFFSQTAFRVYATCKYKKEWMNDSMDVGWERTYLVAYKERNHNPQYISPPTQHPAPYLNIYAITTYQNINNTTIIILHPPTLFQPLLL